MPCPVLLSLLAARVASVWVYENTTAPVGSDARHRNMLNVVHCLGLWDLCMSPTRASRAPRMAHHHSMDTVGSQDVMQFNDLPRKRPHITLPL
jgi:hypothetical protein